MTAPHPLIAALAAERHRRGLTRGQLAARLGYKPQTIRTWEIGRSVPGLERLEDYAAALGCTLALIPEPTAPPAPVTVGQGARHRAELADALGIVDDYRPARLEYA